MNCDLNDLRIKIDVINSEILNLINKRIDVIKEIAKLKDEYSIEYFDAERESEMLEEILKLNHGPLNNQLIKEIFSSIFLASLKHMGLASEKKLLVNSDLIKTCNTIKEIFSLQSDSPIVIAGPCAIEKLEYLDIVAEFLKQKGLKFIRGGAYKPRTSPYEFQGLREEGLKMLGSISKRYNLYSVTEVVDVRDVALVAEYADVLQIGTRNMQNYELLKEIGQTKQPIVLKRGMSATINEFILAAEYIVSRGNNNVIMCERGIRTYETKTRNTLDISTIPIIKKETQLPIIADLSHALGRKDIMNFVARAVLSAGADGIMVEVHPCPELALSDKKQQLNILEFQNLLDFIQCSLQ